MTDILRVVDIMPDEAKHLAQKLHRKKDDIEIYRKSFVGDVEDAAGEERTVVARVSTNDRDRDGEIVEPKGIELKDFQANPVLLWAHDYATPPVGKALWSKTDEKGLVCKFQFAQTQFAEDIYQLYKGGYLRAFSIGFIPTDFDSKTKTYNKISLLEVSCVPVPANQNALVMEAYTKGLVTSEALKHDLGLDEPAPVEETAAEEAEEVAEAPVAEDAAPEAEAKAFDLKGNPSVYDVMDAIMWSLMDGLEPGGPGKGVVDLYPVDYPNGYCIIAESNPDGGPFMLSYQKYRYADGKATLTGEPTPVAPGYVRRSVDPTAAIRDLTKRIDALCAKNETKAPLDIQALIDGGPAGSTIVLPAGEHEVKETIAVTEGVKIVGPGVAPSTITITAPEPVKSEAQALIEFIRSREFTDAIRLEVDKAIGRVR